MLQHLCIPKIFFTEHLNSTLNAEGDSTRNTTRDYAKRGFICCCFVLLYNPCVWKRGYLISQKIKSYPTA